MDLDRMTAMIVASVRSAGLEGQVKLVVKNLAGVERLEVTRKLDSGTRYVRVTPIADAGRAWDFEVLGGCYGNLNPNEDFDGRCGGDGDYVLGVMRRWLFELISWNESIL